MMATKQGPPVQFRHKVVEAEIAARAHGAERLGTIAARDLERYYALMAMETADLPLTSAERDAVRDACTSTAWTPRTIRHAWMAVEDAIRLDGLADRWGIDGVALVAKLKALSLGQAFALVDLVGRGDA